MQPTVVPAFLTLLALQPPLQRGLDRVVRIRQHLHFPLGGHRAHLATGVEAYADRPGQLDRKTTMSISSNTHLYAQPSRAGFFGLSQLQSFTHDVIEGHLDAKEGVFLDFSAVKVWDVAALLWLVVALHHYRRNKGLAFLMQLPEGTHALPGDNREALDKSADYLRRWRFDRALQNIDIDVDRLLVPEQRGYFSPPEPRKYYRDQPVETQPGLLQSLISRRLAEIRSLADAGFGGSALISPQSISACVREFQAERIGDILAVQCGIEKRTADLFGDHLLTEALLNVQEHPNASVALVGISVMGNTNELILTVVDNGDSIPSTIYERYLKDHGSSSDKRPAYSRHTMPASDRATIADHATKRGVTRKKGAEAQKAGMGLTYIKEDAVDTFHGKLWIITDSIGLRYKKRASDPPERREWYHSWPGNLVRIAVPLAIADPL